MTDRLASRMNLVKPSAIRELLRLGADPAIINFGGGCGIKFTAAFLEVDPAHTISE